MFINSYWQYFILLAGEIWWSSKDFDLYWWLKKGHSYLLIYLSTYFKLPVIIILSNLYHSDKKIFQIRLMAVATKSIVFDLCYLHPEKIPRNEGQLDRNFINNKTSNPTPRYLSMNWKQIYIYSSSTHNCWSQNNPDILE